MATAIDTSHVVAAVIGVYHHAASLMKQLYKRSKKKWRAEEATRQKLLLETVEAGETQISRKYSQHLEELGDRFKIGDSE
jgi:hypothetical protein